MHKLIAWAQRSSPGGTSSRRSSAPGACRRSGAQPTGSSLEQLLTYGEALDDTRSGQIAADVAAGLAHAHARGLIHRDLKPANILFDGEDRAKIADFGIARLGGAGTLTEAGTVLGTAAYISPEQASGQTASPASDVYS